MLEDEGPPSLVLTDAKLKREVEMRQRCLKFMFDSEFIRSLVIPIIHIAEEPTHMGHVMNINGLSAGRRPHPSL